ncbi:unnamed protein product [Clonostachys chloroleuca]|uniref:Uncharacterized protein n=1 Tax=Clonostachys chloroleuca TaxID=1926264 RepID=A0AA35LRR9_9HYPO|nr:unnamed protein product [Clonostachys chloroleuca]
MIGRALEIKSMLISGPGFGWMLSGIPPLALPGCQTRTGMGGLRRSLSPTEHAEYVDIVHTPHYTILKPISSFTASREHINQMASLKATLLCIAFGFATTSAAPVAQEFEPPGKECWSNAPTATAPISARSHSRESRACAHTAKNLLPGFNM